MKRVEWIGSSKRDLDEFPRAVLRSLGFALFEAQSGGKSLKAKPLSGFGGAGVLEIVANHDGNTYREVYTVRFEEAIYVLHCFQKKSRSGTSTPQGEIDLVRRRLGEAQEMHERWRREER